MAHLQSLSAVLAGKWHLLNAAADEIHIPHHRVDLLFKMDQEHLAGAILNRVTGEEMPLAEVNFDGSILQLRMCARSETEPSSMPTLVLSAGKDRFEGQWREEDGEVFDAKLKLIRARDENRA
jgi:hypothetical protein